MEEPHFPTPPAKKAGAAPAPYRAPTVAPRPKPVVASSTSAAEEEVSPGVKDFAAELFTRLFVRIAALGLTLGIVYGLIALGQAYGDRIPGAWAGFALMAFVVIGLPLVLVLRVRRLWQRLTG